MQVPCSREQAQPPPGCPFRDICIRLARNRRASKDADRELVLAHQPYADRVVRGRHRSTADLDLYPSLFHWLRPHDTHMIDNVPHTGPWVDAVDKDAGLHASPWARHGNMLKISALRKIAVIKLSAPRVTAPILRDHSPSRNTQIGRHRNAGVRVSIDVRPTFVCRASFGMHVDGP